MHNRPGETAREMLEREYHAAIDRAQLAVAEQEKAMASAREWAMTAEHHREYASQIAELLSDDPDPIEAIECD